MTETKTVWIQGEPTALGGHYAALSRMAKAFSERGWKVCLLTNSEVANTIRSHDAFRMEGLHIIELPPTQLHGKRWHQLEPEEKAAAYLTDLRRLKAGLEALHDPATKPDAIITERWPIAAGICTQLLAGTDRRQDLPMSESQQQEAAELTQAIETLLPAGMETQKRLPGLMKVAQANSGAMLLSAGVRDITGDVRHSDGMLTMLKQHCDEVFVLGGSPKLSDFNAKFAGPSRFPTERVHYLGRFYQDSAAPAPFDPSSVHPIIAQVGFSMNNKPELVQEKMAIFKGSIRAWAQSDELRTHPLQLMAPHDMNATQQQELQSEIEALGETGNKVQLRHAVSPAEFRHFLEQAQVLVTAGGAGATQEALMLHVPMVVLPLSQGSHEQKRRARTFSQQGLAEYVPLRALLEDPPAISLLQAAMDRACTTDRAALAERIMENVSVEGMPELVNCVENRLAHFNEVQQHRKEMQRSLKR